MECTAGIGQKGWCCDQKLWCLRSKWNTLWVLGDGRENSGTGGGRLCMRSCPIVSDLALWLVAQWAPCSWNFPGKNTGVGCRFLLQGFFPTQGSNPSLLHCRQILYHLSHQGRPRILEWVAYPFARGSSWLRNQTRVSCIAGRFFISWATREVPKGMIAVFKYVQGYLKEEGFKALYGTLRSSILAWESPWTEEHGGLQPMETQSQTQLSD